MNVFQLHSSLSSEVYARTRGTLLDILLFSSSSLSPQTQDRGRKEGEDEAQDTNAFVRDFTRIAGDSPSLTGDGMQTAALADCERLGTNMRHA